MPNPKVSVVIPLYNAESFVRAAVESILYQTFSDFELIIINDAATDSGRAIVGQIADSRIKIIDHSKNRGLVASLNHGFSLCTGEYIARMDHDDLSRPDRLEKQVRFLDEHPDVAMVGTWFEYIDKGIVIRSPISPEEIKYYSLENSPFGHPTVMIRRSAITAFPGPYDGNFDMAEDYELWCRIIDSKKTANIPEVLLDYRIHPQQLSAKSALQKEVGDRIRLRQLRKMVGISLPIEKKAFMKLINRTTIRPVLRPFYKIWFFSVSLRSLFSGFLSPHYVIRFYKENGKS
jgi:glycosyltransferase involved in cell wall biosynthesis